MKHAKWILGLIAVLTMQGHADSLAKIQEKLTQQLKAKHVTGAVKLRAKGTPGTSANPPPIRQAAARVRVVKVVLTPNSSGGFDTQEFDVCNTATTLNVYDVRHSTTIEMDPADQDRLQCTSTLLGQVTTIHIGGVVALMNQNLFGSNQDFKTSIPMMTYDVPNTPGQPNTTDVSAVAISGSTDMNARSMLSQLFAISVTSCSSEGKPVPPNPNPSPMGASSGGTSDPGDGGPGCLPSINEYFTAVMDVQD